MTKKGFGAGCHTEAKSDAEAAINKHLKACCIYIGAVISKSIFMEKVNQLKSILGIASSEVLFGITSQPKEQCPVVATFTSESMYRIKQIYGYCKDIKNCDTLDEAKALAIDIDYEAGMIEIQDQLEQLREACELIRLWGQEWKDFAKKLLDDRVDIVDLVADEFNLRLKNASVL